MQLRPQGHSPWLRGLAGSPGALLLIALAGVAVDTFLDLNATSIEAGWLFRATIGLGAAGLFVGVFPRRRRWWSTWGVGIAAGSTALVAAAAWWIGRTGLVGHYPTSFYLWIWLAVWAVGVALCGWWSGGAAVRVARLLAAPTAVLASFLLINAHYGYWPTVGALLGRPATGQVSSRTIYQTLHDRYPPGRQVGEYGPVRIGGRAVGFDAATAYVWLPPAFFHRGGHRLPVLLMLPGWPGNVQDWVKAGQVLEVANAWARAHHGFAPVMVFVDENGAHGYDTECVNSPQGNAETYLVKTVPQFIHRNLKIDLVRSRFAVIGFSEGGTCAVELGTEHPRLFGRFVDLAGDLAPNYGFGTSVRQTLSYLFEGNRAAKEAHDPLTVMSRHTYPHLQGWFGAGAGDRSHLAVAHRLEAAATRAGMKVHPIVIPGGHSWTFAGQAFAEMYPSLVKSMSPGPHHRGPAATRLGHQRIAT